jgi:hypothetical protein
MHGVSAADKRTQILLFPVRPQALSSIYIPEVHNVVPSQHLVRPEVMDAFARSTARNRDLLQRLAK